MQENENMNGFEFSIIIPVYNTLEYLDQCLQSAVSQSVDHIPYEIILVDDGSTDGSAKLCDDWALKYAQIKVIHQKNQGLSAARNTGIHHARGRYIILLDSDDAISAHACRDLYQITKDKQYDMVVTNLKFIFSEGEEMLKHSDWGNEHVTDGKTFLLRELQRHSMHMAAVLQVYRHSFLLERSLSFRVNRLHEDEEFTPRVFLAATEIYVSDLCFYQYNRREQSITNRKDLYQNVHDLYENLKELDCLYDMEQEPLRSALKESLLEKYLYMYAKANVCEKRYDAIRNKAFVKGKSRSWKNRIKVLLFTVNDTWYCNISRKKG